MDKFFEFKTVTMTMCAIHYLTTEFARNTLWKVISATFQVTANFQHRKQVVPNYRLFGIITKLTTGFRPTTSFFGE